MTTPLQMDPDVFPEPERFWPERFLPGGPNEKRGTEINVLGHAGDSIPFGVGRRNCAGYNVARMQNKVAAVAFLRCFDFEVAEDGAVDDRERFQLVVRPMTDLNIRLTPRGPARSLAKQHIGA